MPQNWLQPQNQSFDQCVDIERTSDEYYTAFITNILCLTVPLVISYAFGVWELLSIIDKYLMTIKELEVYLKVVIWLSVILIGIPFAPFFILYVAVRNVIFKYQHQSAVRKSKVRRQLQKSEYLWGILKTAEAGLESCGQLVLQAWLLSSHFKSLSEETFLEIVDKTYNGVIFFLSFSIKDANEVEKSMAKLIMSLIALVFGVSSCYRTLKRGAVGIYNTMFIYVSLFLQIFARIFSIGLYFFTVRSFSPAMPTLLGVHLSLVTFFKLVFERTLHSRGMAARLVTAVNICASTIVYVRIVPIERQKHVRKPIQFQQHSTCFSQSLFFILILIENLLLASWPLMYTNEAGTNRAIECLGKDKILQYVGYIFAMCVGSWIFHIMYYTQMGHPWADINGPKVEKYKIGIPVHHLGKESVLSCGLRMENSDDASEDSNSDTEINEQKPNQHRCCQPCFMSFERASDVPLLNNVPKEQ